MRIAKDHTNGFKISTVKLPCSVWGNHYETIVFHDRQGGDEADSAQYKTEEEARAGHAAMVEKWSKYEHWKPLASLTLAQVKQAFDACPADV